MQWKVWVSHYGYDRCNPGEAWVRQWVDWGNANYNDYAHNSGWDSGVFLDCDEFDEHQYKSVHYGARWLSAPPPEVYELRSSGEWIY
jgi:hypothetical protein